jgi:thiol-disulfide isomerase/thioredoxin
MKTRAVAVFAAVAALSAAGGAGYYLWSSGRAGAPGTDPAAVVERILATPLADVAGGSRHIGQWRGGVLVINYWATWCAPCREEIPVFVRMQQRYGDRGLQFVGIAFDQPDKVAAFASEFRINYPLLIAGLETLEQLRQAGNRAGVLPYTLVLDRKGNLVSREPGGVKEAPLESLVKLLL